MCNVWRMELQTWYHRTHEETHIHRPCWNSSREDLRRREEASHEDAEMTQGRKERHGNLDNDHHRYDDQAYWRPRYMFHWLKAMGGSIHEAYRHFKSYNGKESYVQLGLEAPEHGEQESDLAKGHFT